jgi:hypothetical protein
LSNEWKVGRFAVVSSCKFSFVKLKNSKPKLPIVSKLSISDKSVIKIVGIPFTSMSEKSVPLS